jgi:putative membrane protein
MAARKMEIMWVASFLLVLGWSVTNPKDYTIWALEVSPAIIAIILLALTRARFPLTTLTYVLILIHCIILMVGGHYTYAEVPLFDYLRDVTGMERNNYDKLGHFAQGFIPGIVTREILVRNGVVVGKVWLSFIVVCICLAISAVYEIFEWAVATTSEETAEAFLGMQGYVWDTQADMFIALLGAITAMLLLGRLHDRQLERIVR